jgi:adhesin transport system outer membrane protein
MGLMNPWTFSRWTVLLCSALVCMPLAAQSASGLETALRAAISNHPAISGKRAEVNAKVFGGDSARAQRYPSLSAQLAAQEQKFNQVQGSTNPQTTLHVRQPLWAFGRIESAIAYADADVLAEEADLLRIKRVLLDQTAVAYARVQGIVQRLEVAQRNVLSLERLHQQVQRREQGQLASVADVRLALARLVQARGQRERYEGELAVAHSELLALTRVPVTVEATVPQLQQDLPSLDGLQSMALSASADVQLKAQQEVLAMADVRREETSTRPTVLLQADRYVNQLAYGNDTRLGVVLEATVDGAGFAAIGRNKAASARLQAATEAVSATRIEVIRNVQNLYYNRASQQSQINIQRDTVGELTAILASYQRQYEAGQKAWLDVLNMQREMTDQLLTQVQAENDYLIYTLKLMALTGGLDAQAGETKD